LGGDEHVLGADRPPPALESDSYRAIDRGGQEVEVQTSDFPEEDVKPRVVSGGVLTVIRPVAQLRGDERAEAKISGRATLNAFGHPGIASGQVIHASVGVEEIPHPLGVCPTNVSDGPCGAPTPLVKDTT